MSNLVSVILPVYNAEKFVAAAIQSVLSQTCSNWEIIAVNDGSTDGTAQILEKWASPRVRVIHQKNKGEGGARNTALDAASGAYAAFLDADDTYVPDTLANYVDFFNARPEADVIFADADLRNEEDKHLMYLSESRQRAYEGDILEPLVNQPMTVSMPSSMAARMSAINKNNTRFDETLRYGVDWDFWIQLALTSKFGCLPKVASHYRVFASNMTNAFTVKQRNETLIPGRLKIMRSEWFGGLSAPTRKQFFYYLLVDLLALSSGRQAEVMQSPQFMGLPADAQAHLFQLVASDHILQRADTRFAVECLKRAAACDDKNARRKILLKVASSQPGAYSALLKLNRNARNVYKKIKPPTTAKTLSSATLTPQSK